MFLRIWLALTVCVSTVKLSEAQSPDFCRVINAYAAVGPKPDALSGSAITDWSWVSAQCSSTKKSYDSQWIQVSSKNALNLIFSKSNQSPFTGLEIRKTFNVALSSDDTLSSAKIAIEFKGKVEVKDGSKTTAVQVCVCVCVRARGVMLIVWRSVCALNVEFFWGQVIRCFF